MRKFFRRLCVVLLGAFGALLHMLAHVVPSLWSLNDRVVQWLHRQWHWVDVPKADAPYVLMHENGCKHEALYFVRPVRARELVRADDIVKLDGTQPRVGDLPECGWCGARLSMSCDFMLASVKVRT